MKHCKLRPFTRICSLLLSIPYFIAYKWRECHPFFHGQWVVSVGLVSDEQGRLGENGATRLITPGSEVAWMYTLCRILQNTAPNSSPSSSFRYKYTTQPLCANFARHTWSLWTVKHFYHGVLWTFIMSSLYLDCWISYGDLEVSNAIFWHPHKKIESYDYK